MSPRTPSNTEEARPDPPSGLASVFPGGAVPTAGARWYGHAMRSAAIFDLDRTLLDGGSGPIIGRVLNEQGVTDRSIPGQDILYWFYKRFGENRASMVLAKQGARFTEGWHQATVRQAGEVIAERLQDVMQPFAAAELSKHRKEERLLVLATTTPYDLIEPFARSLGFDDVLATRYGVKDGSYDGTIDGKFVWYHEKRHEVERWASVNDVDLAESYAYSDSRYDVPMLSAVGHPVAVNPDPRLRVLAELRRWPVRYLDAPPGVTKIAGLEFQRFAFPFMQPELLLYADLQISGFQHLPAEGPAIVASNHRSYFDPLAIGYTLAKRDRPGRFLAKKELFEAPLIKQLVGVVGAIPVYRGSGSDEPLHAAAEALDAGEVVVILPQGTIPRGEKFFDPELRGRPGVARLAHMTGAPVIPLGLWGTEHVWPRSSRLPRFLNVLTPPMVTATMGPPVELVGRSAEKDTKRVMGAISDLLPSAAHQARMPTAEELASTYPPG